MWGRASATSAESCSLSSQRTKLLPKHQAVMCSSCALETYPVLPSTARLPSRFLCVCLGGITHAGWGQSFPRALDLWPLYSRVDPCRCAGRARVIWSSLCLLPGLREPSGRGTSSPSSSNGLSSGGERGLSQGNPACWPCPWSSSHTAVTPGREAGWPVKAVMS